MLCSLSTPNNSPVMKVANHTTLPSSLRAHLLCVPGSTSSRSPGASPTSPTIWVSSPRITSGTPSAPTIDSPGTKWMVRPAPVSWRHSARAISSLPAGHGQ